MKTRWLAAVLAVAVLLFVGVFIWATLRTPEPEQTPIAGNSPTATINEAFSVGRINAQVFALGGRNVELQIQFTPDAGAPEAAGMQPSVNVAMAGMQMNGIDPPLQLVQAGVWQARFKLPMAGRWIVNIGMGEDLAGVEFDAD